MKETFLKKYEKPSRVAFLMAVLCALFIGYFLIILTSPTNNMAAGQKHIVSFNENWQCHFENKILNDIDLPVKIDVPKGETLYMERNLPDNLTANSALCFRSTDQKIEVFVNGKSIYSNKDNAAFFGKAIPSGWNFVLLDKCFSGGLLTIATSSPYAHSSGWISEVVLGNIDNLLAQTVNDHILEFTTGYILLTLGFIMMLFALFLRFLDYHYRNIFYLGIFVMIGALWLRVESHVPQVFLLSYFDEEWLSYGLLMLMPMSYALYAKSIAGVKQQKAYTFLFWLFFAIGILRIFFQAIEFLDIAETRFIVLIEVLALLYVVLKDKGRKKKMKKTPYYWVAVLGTVILLASIIAELLAYGFYLYRGNIHGSSLFGIGLLCYSICMIFYTMIHWVINSHRAMILERQLMENRLSLLAGQMQPHFLYNALQSIQELCYTQPRRAADAIVDFSKYLRSNIDYLGKSNEIPFAKELEHINNFIEIEKLRFGDSLQFETKIETEDFTIPFLCLEPLVENAVHHGIRQKNDVGFVRLWTKKENDTIIIKIIDDGVGFDVEKKEERSISNIRQRLENVGGTLEIKSQKKVGTEVTVILEGRK